MSGGNCRLKLKSFSYSILISHLIVKSQDKYTMSINQTLLT